jgi:YHS domain-containing protein
MLVKALIFLLAVFVVYRLFMNDRNKKKKDGQQEKEKLIATGEMVKDPICGTYIDRESSVTVRNGDAVIHFCSYDCRNKYINQLEEKGELEK